MQRTSDANTENIVKIKTMAGPSLQPSRSCCRRGVEPPLVGISSIEAVHESFHEIVLPEKPPGCIRETGRNAARDSSYGDIRTESVSKMLGHTNVQTTQI